MYRPRARNGGPPPSGEIPEDYNKESQCITAGLPRLYPILPDTRCIISEIISENLPDIISEILPEIIPDIVFTLYYGLGPRTVHFRPALA